MLAGTLSKCPLIRSIFHCLMGFLSKYFPIERMNKCYFYDKEKCKKCEPTDLRDSHIFPNFLFRYIKKDIGEIPFRDATNPNLIIRSGIKYRLLCECGEKTFNNYETYFSKKIFYPYVKQKSTSVTYDRSFSMFIISLFWRCFIYHTIDKRNETFWKENKEAHKELTDILDIWKNYLHEKCSLTDWGELYFIPVDESNLEHNQINPVFFITPLTSFGYGIYKADEERLMFYVQIPHFVFIFLPKTQVAQNVDVSNLLTDNGTIDFSNIEYTKDELSILEYISKKEKIDMLKHPMSKKQIETIKKQCESTEEFAKSNSKRIIDQQNEILKSLNPPLQ